MSQLFRYWDQNVDIQRELPDVDQEVLPGVVWGEPSAIFTPAYWITQFWMHGLDKVSESPYRSCGSMQEELVFCMLGGFGITAELAASAFEACQGAQLISSLETSPERWQQVLQQPLSVDGRSVRYRYPNQKAKYLAGAMEYLRSHEICMTNGKKMRDDLLQINGVGPKTAGWVVRNYLDSDEVAILDIHLIRAGMLCDLFSPSQRVEKDYFEMEMRFLEFCERLGARPAVLDCLIWDQMREYGQTALDVLRRKFGEEEGPEAPQAMQLGLPLQARH